MLLLRHASAGAAVVVADDRPVPPARRGWTRRGAAARVGADGARDRQDRDEPAPTLRRDRRSDSERVAPSSSMSAGRARAGGLGGRKQEAPRGALRPRRSCAHTGRSSSGYSRPRRGARGGWRARARARGGTRTSSRGHNHAADGRRWATARDSPRARSPSTTSSTSFPTRAFEVVPDPAHRLQIPARGIVDLPVLVVLSRKTGQASPQPIVITTSAARTASSVSGFGSSAAEVHTELGHRVHDHGVDLIRRIAPGRVHGTRPSERRCRSRAAIWLRPALRTQTNRTSPRRRSGFVSGVDRATRHAARAAGAVLA